MQTLTAIGMSAGIPKVAEATAKGIAAAIGRPLGIDAEKQTWNWENFRDAWVNHPVESFAAVFPFVASFLKGKGITPSESQVKELVDSAVKGEKTPLAEELREEIEEGPPKEAPGAQNEGSESTTAERTAEISGEMEKTGPEETNNAAEGSSASEKRDSQEAEQAAMSESAPKVYLRMAKTLEAAGEPRPPDHVAHHMVAEFDIRAEPARTILQKFDIPLRSADNGTWLPGKEGAGPGAYHPGLNTNKYHLEVNERLLDSTSGEEVLKILRDIKKELSDDTFPYK